MQVDKIILTLRYSKELPNGSWKSIKVGADLGRQALAGAAAGALRRAESATQSAVHWR